MIRSVIFLAALLIPADVNAQQTDPYQYAARVAKEVQPYLSNCQANYTSYGQVYDQDGLAQCKADQAEFVSEYFEALEDNQPDKFDVAFMFQRGEQHGVKYNITMACAWWIEAADTGMSPPLKIFDDPLADTCRSYPDAVAAAQVLEAEAARLANLTY